MTLNLTTTPRSVCQSGVVTLSWQASDPRAFVVLDGFAGTYGASGALTFATAPRVITGHASVACGAGPTGTTTVAAGGDVHELRAQAGVLLQSRGCLRLLD